MIASLIAWLGTCGNILLVYVFMTRTYPISTKYLTVLAILDAMMCILYIMLFGMDAAIVYLGVSNLFVLYHIYIVPTFVLSRITQLAIPYMLILTTLERLVLVSGHRSKKFLKQMFSDRGHHVTIFLLLLSCTILRLPTAFAIVVHHFPNCNDFLRTKSTGPADWVDGSEVYYIFDFHVLSIAQTFIPFIVLVVFNFIIIRQLPKQNVDLRTDSKKEENGNFLFARNFTINNYHGKSEAEHLVSNHLFEFRRVDQKFLSLDQRSKSSSTSNLELALKKRDYFPLFRTKTRISIIMTKPLQKMSIPVRNAVCTMFAIVTSYLISNSLHLILTILERSQFSILRDPDDPMMASTFHTVFSDTVSFVYMFTSAIRIIIYMFNPAVRSHLKDFLPCKKRRRSLPGHIAVPV